MTRPHRRDENRTTVMRFSSHPKPAQRPVPALLDAAVSGQLEAS